MVWLHDTDEYVCTKCGRVSGAEVGEDAVAEKEDEGYVWEGGLGARTTTTTSTTTTTTTSTPDSTRLQRLRQSFVHTGRGIIEDGGERYHFSSDLLHKCLKLYTAHSHEFVRSLQLARNLAAVCLYLQCEEEGHGLHLQQIVLLCQLSNRGRKKVFWNLLKKVQDKRAADECDGESRHVACHLHSATSAASSCVWTQHRRRLMHLGLGYMDWRLLHTVCIRLRRVVAAKKSTLLAALLVLLATHRSTIQNIAPEEAAALTGVSACSVRRHLRRLKPAFEAAAQRDRQSCQRSPRAATAVAAAALRSLTVSPALCNALSPLLV